VNDVRPQPLLRLDEVNTYYGQIHILQGVSLEVQTGELVCLLGGNASGKSTTLKTILGIVRPRSGRVEFAGENVGAYLRKDDLKADYERVYELFPLLYERRSQLAGTLSGGEQQMLAMGRALMSRPRLLLMDEPSMGLAPILVEKNFEIIKQVHETGVAILVVEQNANVSLGIADRGYVLQTGNVVLADRADALLAHEDLKKAYLGR
jgi:branched-chain amino acid transport system ATP-binding protein